MDRKKKQVLRGLNGIKSYEMPDLMFRCFGGSRGRIFVAGIFDLTAFIPGKGGGLVDTEQRTAKRVRRKQIKTSNWDVLFTKQDVVLVGSDLVSSS